MDVDKDFNRAVGLRIRKMRESLRMTREQFSELCNISNSFLAAIESGQKSLTTKTLYKICKNASIPADYIIFGKESDPKSEMILVSLNGMNAFQQDCATRILIELSEALKKNFN